MKYYQMTAKTCLLCKHSDGLADDGLIPCTHQIGDGILELKIKETEALLKDLKKAKRYATLKALENK